MSVTELKIKVMCAGIGCKNKVLKFNTEKRILCRKCWLEKAEKAARRRDSVMHIAWSDQPHEFVRIDNLEEFIDQYDIEGKGESE
jgi:hypothetical protein